MAAPNPLSPLSPTLLHLLQLGALTQSSILSFLETSLAQSPPEKSPSSSTTLPPKPLFDAQRNILAATGSLTEAVIDPSARLLEVSSQFFEARALHIVADLRVADILDESGEDGVTMEELATRTGVETRKLGRIMRCLCSIHVFRELTPGRFANNRISQALVGNEPLRSYMLLYGLDLYTASDYLPKYLTTPSKGASYDVACTPWQDAVGTSQARWEWLEEILAPGTVSAEDKNEATSKSAYPGAFGNTLKETLEQAEKQKEVSVSTGVPRPEHKIFGLAMLGGGRITGEAHLHDFPWSTLPPQSLVVDVGGGVGGFCLQLSHLYPHLHFAVQDRPPVLQQAQTSVWPRENPAALAEGRVRFIPHSFFDANPVSGASVYWLRYILHDWSDEYCVTILSRLREALGPWPQSRILICDQVMDTTAEQPTVPGGRSLAPKPLLANWGYVKRYSHQRDLAMMSIINGIERTPDEFRVLASKAGLVVRKMWECRSQVGLVEMGLPDAGKESTTS